MTLASFFSWADQFVSYLVGNSEYRFSHEWLWDAYWKFCLEGNCSACHVSHVMRKPVYAICKQQRPRSACTAAQSDQHLCCHYLDSIIPILAKSKISCLYLASVAAQASLCLTWSQTPKTDFLMTRLMWCWTVILNDRIFNGHQTTSMDSFSCIPFLQHMSQLMRFWHFWAFAGRLYDKYHNLMSWLVYI